jgi:hypothetical protein
MKSIVMPKNVQLTEEFKEQLKIEVKETLATDANNKSNYTAAEMWNRQRQTRSASDRMRRWNLN